MDMLQQQLLDAFSYVSNILWGWPLLLPLIIVGFLYTFGLKGLQFRQFARAMKMALWERHSDKHHKHSGDISHFQALMTALSATVGTGNIAGVATAVTLGGPGAIFWMWMIGLIGMATKYAEAVLGVHYRIKNENGEMSGGPMYYIEYGLGKSWKPLAWAFSFFLAIAALGIGNMVQSNSIADVMGSTFSIDPVITGVVLAIIVSLVIIGGIKRIGKVAERIVPFMILLYVVAGSAILIINADQVPAAFSLIFNQAFVGIDIFGAGVVGAAVRYGVARGVFSNESGMGSSPIVAAAAKTDHPVSQALVSMTQTFIDTLIVCSFTGLIIIMSGLSSTNDGATLTALSFSAGLGDIQLFGYQLGNLIVTTCLLFFVFSTILGWYYYGEKGVSYILGEKSVFVYKLLFIASVFVGAVIKLTLAWTIAEVFTALMIIPNLIALIFLFKKVRDLTNDYFKHEEEGDYKVKPFHNG